MIYRILSTAVLMLFMFSVGITGTLDSDVKVSLQFEDIALSTVLNMFAEQYDLNLIQSGQIDGNVSVKLDNVKLRDALEAILASNGYNYYLAGDIIVVKPLEMNAIGEMVARTIKLDYITPSAAINAISDLLSSKGKIKVVQGTSGNSSTKESVPTKIVIVDLPDVVDMITAFIKEIDCRQPQVAIKVRLIETNIDDDTKIGFKWPTNLSARLHGVQGSSSSTSGSTESSEAFAQMQLPDGGWTWGKMSIAEVSAALEFLDLQGNSKLISDPYITTLDNHEAEIKVTTIIPIQTINRFSEGGSVQDIVSFQDEEIGITLLVTPHITNDGQIILDVKPSVAEIIGYSGPADSQKPITSERSIHTKIIVKNNETAVLGGLMKENKIEEEQRVFFLGSLPIIGGLFRHKSTQTRTTDLTIMITPTIIRD